MGYVWSFEIWRPELKTQIRRILFLLLVLTIGSSHGISHGHFRSAFAPESSPQQRESKSTSGGNEAAASATVNPDLQLLEIGTGAKPITVSELPPAIKAVSYNIRWRGGDDLRKIAQFLKEDLEIGGAAVVGLQEVDRNKKRTGNKNTARMLAEELGMHYAWAAPPPEKSAKEEETGVAIMSPYPLSNVQRIVLPHEGPGKRRRVALGATVTIGSRQLRVYSVHSETRISFDKKLEQWKAVLADLASYRNDMPAIVLGDLNTWEPGAGAKTTKLFTAAGFHTPFDGQSTFCRRILFVSFDLKLDWIWLRNLEAIKHGVDREIKLSDHWPLWITLAFKPSAHEVTKVAP
jgi:endonuclease/exonuclease/phosphatase family metal-dependent hydrolase